MAPAQVAISPDGDELVVTEKAHQPDRRLPAQRVSDTPPARPRSPPRARRPFGFDFTPSGRLAVSEAGPSAASTYAVGRAGLRTISASVAQHRGGGLLARGHRRTADSPTPATGAAPSRSAATGSAGNSSLSLFGRRRPDGHPAAGGVSDIALSAGSDFLYARLGDGTVGAVRRQQRRLAELPVAPASRPALPASRALSRRHASGGARLRTRPSAAVRRRGPRSPRSRGPGPPRGAELLGRLGEQQPALDRGEQARAPGRPARHRERTPASRIRARPAAS